MLGTHHQAMWKYAIILGYIPKRAGARLLETKKKMLGAYVPPAANILYVYAGFLSPTYIFTHEAGIGITVPLIWSIYKKS